MIGLTDSYATEAISGSGTGETGWSHTCRPAMVKIEKAPVP